MAVTNRATIQSGQSGARTDAGNGTHNTSGSRRLTWLETKPFVKTSEFWMTVVGIIAVLVAGYVIKDPAFKLFRAWMLATVIASAYIVSRGIAKAGPRHETV